VSGQRVALGRRRENSEDGLTLVEMLVAMMVLAVLLALVGGLFASSSKIIATTQVTGQGTTSAANIADELSNVIRSGANLPVTGQTLSNPALPYASNEALTMYSYVDSYTSSTSTQVRPLLVQLSLNSARQLVEKRWVPLSTSGTYFTFPTVSSSGAVSTPAPTSTRIIGDPILTTPTTGANTDPLFVYLNASGGVIASPVAAANLCSIASVRVTVRTQGAATTAHPAIVLVNTVDIPNLPPNGC
jgi:prepilin-type N-terminal cleavage/methylation domain-containing protein